MQEMQSILLDEKSPKKAVDRANIQLEKLNAEYEQYDLLVQENVRCMLFRQQGSFLARTTSLVYLTHWCGLGTRMESGQHATSLETYPV